MDNEKSNKAEILNCKALDELEVEDTDKMENKQGNKLIQAIKNKSQKEVLDFLNSESDVFKIELNESDENGISAISHAAKYHMFEVVNVMLRRGATDDGDVLGQTVLMKLCTLDQKKDMKQKEKQSKLAINLILLKKGNDDSSESHYVFDSKYFDKEDKNSRRALDIAIRSRMRDVVKHLLDRGASCTYHGQFGVTPLIMTAARNFPKMTKLLLDLKDEKMHNRIDLNHINRETEDLTDENALSWAINQNSNEVIHMLLDRGASLYKNDGSLMPINEEAFTSFLDKYIRKESTSLKDDKIVDTEENDCPGKFHDCLVIDFNIKFLHDGGTELIRNLTELSAVHKKKIIKHPLIQAFLMMRWRKMWKFWMMWILLKISYFALLFWMAYHVYHEVPYSCDTVRNHLEINDCNNNTVLNQIEIRSNSTISTILFFLIWLFFVIVEIGQLVVDPIGWWSSHKNKLQVIILGMSFYLICVVLFFYDHPTTKTSNRSKLCFGFLFPLVYYEFLFELGIEPRFKKYISMFNGVFKSFLGYFVIYGAFLVTFTIGFSWLLPLEDAKSDNDWPSSNWLMLPKVFVMFTGEQEFMDIPFSEPGSSNFVWEIIFFFGFVVLMVIVLLNLLNAVAIKDAKQMHDEAEKEKLYELLRTAEISGKIFMKNTFFDQRTKKRIGYTASINTDVEKDEIQIDWRFKWIYDCLFNVFKNNNSKFYFLIFREAKKDNFLVPWVENYFSSKKYYGYSENPWMIENQKMIINEDLRLKFVISPEIAELCKKILKEKKVKKNLFNLDSTAKYAEENEILKQRKESNVLYPST